MCDYGYRQRDPRYADQAKHKAEPDALWDKSEKTKEARFATVEPVFGDLRHNKRLARFTLRGRERVDGQWKLYCLAHNVETIGHHGYAN